MGPSQFQDELNLKVKPFCPVDLPRHTLPTPSSTLTYVIIDVRVLFSQNTCDHIPSLLVIPKGSHSPRTKSSDTQIHAWPGPSLSPGTSSDISSLHPAPILATGVFRIS